MIQQYKLSEAEYRGERFGDWKGKDLKGSLELLNLTQPQIVEEIHADYLNAGADVVETNTFSGTTIGLNDFLFQGEPMSVIATTPELKLALQALKTSHQAYLAQPNVRPTPNTATPSPTPTGTPAPKKPADKHKKKKEKRHKGF